jgi:PilZ domain
MEQPERRTSRRFPLRQTAYVRLLENGSETISGTTQNVSKDGVLLLSASPLPVGSRTELILVLESRLERSIRLSGTCKVLRVEENAPPGKYSIAFVCEHPFAMMD